MTSEQSPDTPQLGGGGDMFAAGPAAAGIVVSRDDALNTVASEALTALASAGSDDAERNYQRALAALRERDSQAGPSLADAYRRLDEDRYQERWAVVQLVTDLRTPTAVDFLADVLAEPIPEEHGSDPVHGLSTVAEEVVIRTTALEALSRLIAGGSAEAAAVVYRQLDSDVRSIRRAAVQAATDAADADLVRRVRERLTGTDDEWMLRVRRVGVGSVPQPNPDGDPHAGGGTTIPPEPFSK